MINDIVMAWIIGMLEWLVFLGGVWEGFIGCVFELSLGKYW